MYFQGASGTTAAEAGSLLNYGFDNFQMLSLGDTDFNMLSGGNVYVPVGNCCRFSYHKDGTPENGQYTRQYYFGNAPVGTSVMAAVQEQDTAHLTDEARKIWTLPEATPKKHTAVPYYVIAGVGVLLLGF